MMIPLSRVSFTHNEFNAVKEVLKSGWLTAGPRCRKFEVEFAKYIGTRYAVSMNSCASALQLALEAHELKGEVILPSFTFVASINAVINAGCVPRFVDVEYNSCNIDPDKLRKAVNDKTVAVMPVHYAGQSCRMDAIGRIAGENRLLIIEDSAEAIGAEYEWQKTGSFGTGCFSFFPTKNITCGEGGMITTSDERLRDKVSTFINHGVPRLGSRRRKTEDWHKEALVPGYNFRMTDIQAALGIAQLERIAELNALRRRHAAYLNKHLPGDELDLPFECAGCTHVYQMYTIKLKSKKSSRGSFLGYLRKKGIHASVHFYPPLHRQKIYKRYRNSLDDLSITERLSENIVTLPLYPSLRRCDLDYIVSGVKEGLRKSRE